VATRLAPVCILVVAGALQDMPLPAQSAAADADSPSPRGQPPDPAPLCGILGGNGHVTAQGVTLPQVARSVANYPVVSRAVTDRTGRSSRDDWPIELMPVFLNGPNPDSPPIARPAADSGANFYAAMQEQLGLKLYREKAPVKYLVIDLAEQPTED
jgi:uncharacterized protein (TIGR03435 family)